MRKKIIMNRDDVERIDVQGKRIGIVGLADAIEDVARKYSQSPREIAEQELLARLSVKNYCDAERTDGLTIEILGPGCYQCSLLERNVIDAVAEMGLPASVEHVTDIKAIGEYGVMGTPALVVNGQVLSVGRLVSKEEIRQLLGVMLERKEEQMFPVV